MAPKKQIQAKSLETKKLTKAAANKALLAARKPAAALEALASGADPNTMERDESVLYWRLFQARFDVAQVLVDHGADIECATESGTLLIGLCDCENEKINKPELAIALWLIGHGASCTQARPDGTTPLMHAARARNSRVIIDALIAHGARPVPDNHGDTPLHWAVSAECGDPWVWRRLLEIGNDLEAKNRHGETPLSLAQTAGSREAVTFLLARGADRNVTVNGKTLLQRATAAKQPKKMLALLGG